MSKIIKLTISDKEFQIVKHEAESRGMKPSGYVKMSVFSYVNKYPSKGVFAELSRALDQI